MITIEVIIPTRENVIPQCITGININTPPITNYTIMVDEGEGQAVIRHSVAKKSKADYVLILDDDVFMPEGLVQKYLDKILEGYDAVCGNTNPVPSGPFGKYIKQYMTNPSTFFYAVGCTLWKRKRFIKIMEDVGINVRETVLQKQILKDNYNVVRVEDAVCDHVTYVTALNFFKKRIIYGSIIGKSAKKDKTFIKTYLKFLFGIAIPYSRNGTWGRGVFLYRLGTFVGMTKYLWGIKK